jgi:hypothetical protein
VPTVKGIAGPYRFFFYSFDCNEPAHVHVAREKASCKFWLTPLELASNSGFKPKELSAIRRLIEAHRMSIWEAWIEHCN